VLLCPVKNKAKKAILPYPVSKLTNLVEVKIICNRYLNYTCGNYWYGWF
jgi:hypothetical protein